MNGTDSQPDMALYHISFLPNDMCRKKRELDSERIWFVVEKRIHRKILSRVTNSTTVRIYTQRYQFHFHFFVTLATMNRTDYDCVHDCNSHGTFQTCSIFLDTHGLHFVDVSV
jgi:hypothetical protein